MKLTYSPSIASLGCRNICIRWKFASETVAGVLSRFFLPPQQQYSNRKNSSDKDNILVFGLEKVVFREGNCQENRKLPSLTLYSGDSMPKLKSKWLTSQTTIPFHWKWFGHRLNNSLNCLAGLWTFLHLKDMKYHCNLLFWSYTVVLAERTMSLAGYNKSRLHLMRALCFCIIIISYLEFLMYIIHT